MTLESEMSFEVMMTLWNLLMISMRYLFSVVLRCSSIAMMIWSCLEGSLMFERSSLYFEAMVPICCLGPGYRRDAVVLPGHREEPVGQQTVFFFEARYLGPEVLGVLLCGDAVGLLDHLDAPLLARDVLRDPLADDALFLEVRDLLLELLDLLVFAWSAETTS